MEARARVTRPHVHSCAHTYPPNTRVRTLLDVYTRLSLSGDKWQQLIVYRVVSDVPIVP